MTDRPRLRTQAFAAGAQRTLGAKGPAVWRDRTLAIVFEGQSGVDWGGLTKAFINLMVVCLFEAEGDGALFTAVGKDADVDGLVLDGTTEGGHKPPSVAGRRRLLPDSRLQGVPDWERRLRFIGQFVGYMVWSGEVADLPLLPSVYGYLCGESPYWRAFMLDDPKTYEGMVAMQGMSPDQVEFMCQTMSYGDPADPAGPPIELVRRTKGCSAVFSASIIPY
jgi:hypothetical protein